MNNGGAFDALPEPWRTLVQILILVIPSVGIPGTVTYLLSRRSANRQLNVTEEAQDDSRFKVVNEGYDQLLERLQGQLNTADAKIKEQGETISTQGEQITEVKRRADDLEGVLRDMRGFVKRMFLKYGVVLTTEEQAEFDRTKPAPQRRR